MPIIFVVPPAPPTPMPYGPGTILQVPYGDANGVPLNKVDDYGVEWLWSDIEGWDGPEAATQFTQRTAQDGSWSGTPLYAQRAMTLSGGVWCDSPERLRDAHDRLMAAITKEPFQLKVDEHGLERFVTVQRVGAVTWNYYTSTGASWSFQVVATDPRKYSTELSTATIYLGSVDGGFSLPFSLPFSIDATITTDTISALNRGNIDAPLTLQFHGPVTNPILSQPTLDRQVQINLPLGGDQFVDVLTDTHKVLLGGTTSRLYAKEGDWLSLPPGNTDLRFLAESYDSSAFVNVTWRSTWI